MLYEFFNTISWFKIEEIFDKIVSQSGVLLVIKVQNYNDLLLVLSEGEVKVVFERFKLLLSMICKISISHIVQYNTYFIVILPKINSYKVATIAHNIYYKSQMFLSQKEEALSLLQEFPLLYKKLSFNCKIVSICFPEYGNQLSLLLKTLLSYVEKPLPGYYLEFSCLNYGSAEEYIGSVEQKFEDLVSFKKFLATDQLVFAYQPIIESKSGKILHYECLLRVPDHSNKLISAGPVILLAEELGFINIIDKKVLEFAVEELSNVANIKLAINISNLGVIDSELLDVALKLLSSSNVASRLIIEITETALNNDFIKTKRFIEKMHKQGCQIAIDDFGAGFTSFKQLRELPVDIVKIDGSFIQDITSNCYNRFLVETLVKMSEELGIKTIAEFVENGQIARLLIDIKVDCMQGNFFYPATNYRFWQR